MGTPCKLNAEKSSNSPRCCIKFVVSASSFLTDAKKIRVIHKRMEEYKSNSLGTCPTGVEALKCC